MNDRERFVACLLGEPVDRPPFWLYWGPWGTTRARWQREGMPAAITDIGQAFGSDALPMHIPVNYGPCPPFARTVLQEDDRSVTFIDEWGIKRRDLKGRESMSQFLEHPVTNRGDWARFKAERLDPDHPDRLNGDWQERCAAWMAQGYPIHLGGYPDVGLFGGLRWLLGAEGALMAFYTMPDLVHEIMDHLTSLYLTVFEALVRKVQADVICIWEDLCYRKGPLMSPRVWEAFIAPNYRRLRRFAREHNIPLISVDTDGNPDELIAPMLAAGVNYLYPFEVAAGCDVNGFRQKYPTLGMMGGIDKRVLARGPEAIERELARIAPAVAKGRYIPELDHLVPDDVSWANYTYYVERLKRLVGKA